MLAISKVIIAVKSKLEKNFKNIEIQSQDIEEGFLRPSFFIELDNIKIDDFMKKIQETNLTVRITYFPTNIKKNQVENLSVIDKLNQIFIEDNLLELEKGYITEINDVNSTLNNRLVHYNFDISLSEEYIRKINKEIMDDIEITLKKDKEVK